MNNTNRSPYRKTDTINFCFWDFVGNHLPPPKDGYIATDIDLLLENYKTKKYMFLELKTSNAPLKSWQRKLFAEIHAQNIDRPLFGFTYLGFHTLILSGTNFDNSIIRFDNKIISQSELITKLTF